MCPQTICQRTVLISTRAEKPLTILRRKTLPPTLPPFRRRKAMNSTAVLTNGRLMVFWQGIISMPKHGQARQSGRIALPTALQELIRAATCLRMTTSPTLLQTMKVRPRTYFPFRSTRHALTGDSFSIGIIYTIPSRLTTIQPLNLGTDPAQCLHLLSPLIRTIKERRDG